ncbi:MAG: hypothetical protein AB7F09_18485 [Parvibaculaceae bacterium]
MNIPEWIKPAVWGGVAGAVVFTIIGFSAGWVVTSASAEKMAKDQGEKAALAALAPICVAQFKSQSQDMQTTQLAALEKESSYKRGDYVEKQGWATLPGSEKPNDDVADACAVELMKLVQT